MYSIFFFFTKRNFDQRTTDREMAAESISAHGQPRWIWYRSLFSDFQLVDPWDWQHGPPSLLVSDVCPLSDEFHSIVGVQPFGRWKKLNEYPKNQLTKRNGGSSSIDFFSFWLFIDRPPLGAKTAARNAPCRPPPKMFGTRLANIFLLLKQRPRGAGWKELVIIKK